MKKIVVIGGGAAGFFAALRAKEVALASQLEVEVILLEKTGVFLSKVRVSGGGRCNVTHACFDPVKLIENYPRGSKELLGSFHQFQPKDTIRWFEERGVALKTEEDGRIFPQTNSSETIIQTLLNEAKKNEVILQLRERIETPYFDREKGKFILSLREGRIIEADRLILATGSSSEGHEWAKMFGHTIIPPIPSLFTLNVSHFSLSELSGVSLEEASLSIEGNKKKQQGSLLFTHFGFSGPAAIKLSAWLARELSESQYRAHILLDWLPSLSQEELYQELRQRKEKHPEHFLATEGTRGLFPTIPKRAWRLFLQLQGWEEKKWGQLSDKMLKNLSEHLKKDRYQMEGKTTHKEEFVTCGGVALSEVNFKTMESRKIPGLFFVGEILDVDGVTGGFNFQHAWTSGWIAGTSASL